MYRMRQWLNLILMASVGTIGVAPPVAAELIGTDKMVPDSQASSERERVTALVARPEVAKQLQAMGVPPENVKARVDALTDQEVHALATRLDSLPAGGNFSDFQWIMIVIGAIIIALLI